MNRGIPPLTAVLLMAALSLVGLVSLPKLNIQYTPTIPGREISVSYSYPDASAEIVEAEVTSILEGALSSLGGTTNISSTSRKGSGSVIIRFRKGKDMDAARFEVASSVRNVYPSLPSGVSYPSVQLSSGGGNTSISYILKGPMSSQEMEKYAREHILPHLSALADVDGVTLSGATPFHWVITFDAEKTATAGITADDIASVLRSAYANQVLGLVETRNGTLAVRLIGDAADDFGTIPVKKVGDRVLYLRDLATWQYKESLPTSYFRVNGLNTITLAVSTTKTSNLLSAVSAVKEEMARLQTAFPEELTASVSYDASDYVLGELRKIYMRTAICILILLLFVFITSRSWRYLFILSATLVVNVLTALAIYALVGLQIHIYTLAGITVSLGMVIDTSIVMADHFGYWGNRRIFPALFWATVTTVAALLTVLLLPESERTNLTDFIWVIVINLSLSLLIAYLFIPSLMSFLPTRPSSPAVSFQRKRHQVKRNLFYGKYIAWGMKHRWVLMSLFVLAFGIPVCLVPYARENYRTATRILSSSFGRFYEAMDHSNFYRQPERKQLYINAGMLEGCTVAQLNEVVKAMENYLTGFDEIESFTTQIYDYDNARIVVEFKPQFERTPFPLQLKSQVTAMAINFGGANWSVYGIDQNAFNNNIVSSYKGCHILLSGYNYQQLLGYAAHLVNFLSANRRVSEPEIWSSHWGRPSMEFNLDYDFEAMTTAGINPYRYYGELSSKLYNRPIGNVVRDGDVTEVVLRSSDTDCYDLWHILNAPIPVDSLKMTLSSVGNIVKKRSGIEIRKSNQSYQLDVCFDFIGNYQLQKRLIDNAVTHMNNDILPLGFKAENPQGGWYDTHKERYAWLIFLIVAVIFVLLSMSLESLRLPLAIIFMIPISFIGLFLVFGLSDFSFDQGGFAAFVMLCGIVVNAGIYFLTTYQRFGGPFAPSRPVRIRLYIKAFNHKLVPVSLTISSTVTGLLPFLSDGPEEVFWFDFAVGTIGGLAFSLIALFLYLPVFAVRKNENSELKDNKTTSTLHPAGSRCGHRGWQGRSRE